MESYLIIVFRGFWRFLCFVGLIRSCCWGFYLFIYLSFAVIQRISDTLAQLLLLLVNSRLSYNLLVLAIFQHL